MRQKAGKLANEEKSEGSTTGTGACYGWGTKIVFRDLNEKQSKYSLGML